MDPDRLFLQGRKERKVIELIVQHLSMVQRCVKELKQMLSSLEQMNSLLVRNQAEIVSKFEGVADDLQAEPWHWAETSMAVGSKQK